MIHVTTHAIQRFQERVAACTIDEARSRILAHSKAIEAAAAFGCEIVRCGTGERLVLNGTRVLTVYAPHNLPHQCRSPYGRDM
jgi:hypothetical protein